MYYGKIISTEAKEKILELFHNGETIKDISKLVNLGTHCVKKCVFEEYSLKSITDIKQQLNKDNVNEHQIQCIYGSLLGDSSLSKKLSTNNFLSYSFATSHCDVQKEYLIHKAEILNTNPHSYTKNDNSWSPGSIYWKTTYHNKLFLQDVYETCFINDRKTVSQKWVDIIDWEGIAYWFMDDGCSHAYKNAQTIQVNFSTLSFIKPEIDLLINKFCKLGISSHTVKSQHGNGIVLTIDSGDVNNFMSKIEPFMVSCMDYKIKKDNRK
ncbi:MAG: hypothetical protein ACREBJ_00395 [Nitrosotalea sp.]